MNRSSKPLLMASHDYICIITCMLNNITITTTCDLSIYLSIYHSIYLFIYLSIYHSIYLFIYLSMLR